MSRRRRLSWLAAGRLAGLSIGALVLVAFPLWVVVVNSLKTQSEAAQIGLGLPTTWHAVENYSDVFEQSHYPVSLLNSVLVTGSSVAFLVAFGSLAAWAYARARSRWMRFLYGLSLVGILVPAAVVPTVFLMRGIKLQGTQVSLIVFTIGMRMSLVIFLLTGFARALPIALEEAATVDGASRLRIFVSIVLPLLRPALASTFVILVVLTWNDFFAPLFLLVGQDRMTLPLGLYQLGSGIAQLTAWQFVFAHVVLVSLPLLFVYAFAQRRIVEGVTAGAVLG